MNLITVRINVDFFMVFRSPHHLNLPEIVIEPCEAWMKFKVVFFFFVVPLLNDFSYIFESFVYFETSVIFTID